MKFHTTKDNYMAKLGFFKKDLINFVPSEDQSVQYAAIIDKIPEYVEDWFSVYRAQDLILFGGYAHHWNGRCSLFAVYSNGMSKRDWLFVCNNTGEYINILRSLGYYRIESNAHCSDKKFSFWLEKLGFVKEGMMKKYGIMGEDCYLYSMVFP